MTIHLDRSVLPAPSRRQFMIGAAGFTFTVASGLPFGATQAASGKEVALSPWVTISTDEPKVTKRPTLQQEIQKRAVEEPPLVRAAAPSR